MTWQALEDCAPQLDGSSADASPGSVPVDDLDGPLCALSIYLSAAERLLQAPELDREKLGQALQGARSQLADLARKAAEAASEASP